MASCSSARPNSGMVIERWCKRKTRTHSNGRSCETKWAHRTRAREFIFVLDAPNPPTAICDLAPCERAPCPSAAPCLASPAVMWPLHASRAATLRQSKRIA